MKMDDGYDAAADSMAGYDQWCAWRRLALTMDRVLDRMWLEFNLSLTEMHALPLAERVALLGARPNGDVANGAP